MFTIKRKNKRKKVINYFLVHLLVNCQNVCNKSELVYVSGAGINDRIDHFQRQVYKILNHIFTQMKQTLFVCYYSAFFYFI